MKKSSYILVAVAILLLSQAAFAQNSGGQEELVYFICTEGPVRFSMNFYTRYNDTIYVLAGKTHAINARKTVLEYSAQYDAFLPSPDVLYTPIEGSLEIRNSAGSVTKLELSDFTFGVVQETDPTELLTKKDNQGMRIAHLFGGEKAVEAFRNFGEQNKIFQAAVERYSKEVDAYQRVMQSLEQEMNALSTEFLRRQQSGEDLTSVMKAADELEAKAPSPPAAPQVPEQIYELEKAYFLTLPAGNYAIHMVSKEGQVIEGTEKKLVVFPPTDALGIVYDVIPHLKDWISPNDSRFPGSVIYLSGSDDIVLRPYAIEEYPNPEYTTSIYSIVKAIPSMTSQVKIGYPRKSSFFEITKQGSTQTEALSTFVTAQSSVGYGFSVMELEKAEQDGARVNEYLEAIEGIRLDTKGASGVISFRLLTESKDFIPGSEREIRIVRKVDLFIQISVALGLALLPFAIWFLLWFFAGKPKSRAS